MLSCAKAFALAKAMHVAMATDLIVQVMDGRVMLCGVG